jgi:hypothetical protein
MHRREFLFTAATATAVLSTPPAIRSAEASRRIPIGFLGATYSRGPDKIKLTMTSPDWEFVGTSETL